MLSNQMGKTVLISSHLLSEVELIANRMIIIHKGKKMVEGRVSDLLDPAHSLIQIETNNNHSALEKLKQTDWVSFLKGDGQLKLMMNKDEVPRLISDLVAMEVQILSVNPSHSLENYFISLTTEPGYVEPFAN